MQRIEKMAYCVPVIRLASPMRYHTAHAESEPRSRRISTVATVAGTKIINALTGSPSGNQCTGQNSPKVKWHGERQDAHEETRWLRVPGVGGSICLPTKR